MFRTRIDACYEPRQVFCCPFFLEKLAIAKHVGIVCQSRLSDFMIEEDTEQQIFIIKKGPMFVCMSVAHWYSDCLLASQFRV